MRDYKFVESDISPSVSVSVSDKLSSLSSDSVSVRWFPDGIAGRTDGTGTSDFSK